MNIALDEQIKLLSKQLKIPTFADYHKIQNHADANSTFGELFLELMRAEYDQRQENNNRRRLKQANFPLFSLMTWTSLPTRIVITATQRSM